MTRVDRKTWNRVSELLDETPPKKNARIVARPLGDHTDIIHYKILEPGGRDRTIIVDLDEDEPTGPDYTRLLQ